MPVLNQALNILRLGWSIGVGLATKAWGQAITQQVNNLMQAVNDVTNTWIWSGVRQAGFWNADIHPRAQSMEHDLLHAFGDTSASLNHIVTVIIPNSVKTGTSKNWGGIRGVRQQIKQLQGRADRTALGLATLHRYINQSVNPYITGYRKFVYNWDKYWGPPMQTLIDWIAAPALLSAKLTPTMTPDVVNALVGGRHTPLLDKLLGALAAHSVDLPKKYPSAAHWIDRGVVALLNSGKY